MTANRFSADAYRQFEVGALYGVDPGDGGTLEFNHKSGVVFRCPGDGSNTRLLPAESIHPIGTTCVVMNTGTGNLEVKEDSDTTIIVTIPQSQASELMLIDGNGARAWVAFLYT